jgi:RNA polymerase sigma-70 factor (ECF subfamily)
VAVPAGELVTDRISPRQFERLALPHLDAAYSLARWLTRNEHDAEDVVQDAYLRAYKYFASYRGENFRAWLLAVVRRAAYDWLQRNRPAEIRTQADIDTLPDIVAEGDPEAALLRKADQQLVNTMIEALPPQFREVVILRELQELSYQDIAEITSVPVGTVMSRLSRARAMLAADGRRRLKESTDGR